MLKAKVTRCIARKCELNKTMRFTSRNACQSFRGLCVHDSEIVDKSSQTRFSSESRKGSLSASTSFELVSVERVPEGSPERLAGILGRFWGVPGRSWAPKRLPTGLFGEALGVPGATEIGKLGAFKTAWIKSKKIISNRFTQRPPRGPQEAPVTFQQVPEKLPNASKS